MGIEIIHRWWVGETICTVGEEVFMANVFNREFVKQVPLSLHERVALDRFARRKTPQSSTQWAASLNADRWVQNHGANSSERSNLRCHFSRNGIKQIMHRLGYRISQTFEDVGMVLHRKHLFTRMQCGKEVLYGWNPQILVTWNHLRS